MPARADASAHLTGLLAAARRMDGTHYTYGPPGEFTGEQVGASMARLFYGPFVPFMPRCRCVFVPNAVPWLDAISWAFPTWRVRARPFDWMVDDADLPLPPAPSPWSLPDRQQADVFLRPPPATVQR